ncbi:hypothetical protein RvY_03172 [Ramazzottius varieornatus]|uniref:SDE2-like domain-containing protein n=1 Tax=Ramazzottius varieornatus TaxID=947166 RepID=A0A1D1UU70_RAMVA|nr:hypothetical protein RvY_03172 [Ramazzottius varieornatus]
MDGSLLDPGGAGTNVREGEWEGCVFVRGIPATTPANLANTRCLLLDSVNWEPTVGGLKGRCLRGSDDQEVSSDVLDLFYVLSGGRVLLDETCALTTGNEYTLQCRLRGGKGGFGSLLRSFGSQISKNRNQDACRDLSGRRIRNVKAEQKIQELAGRQADKEKQKKLQKEEKIKKLKSQLECKPKHSFNDAEYEAERSRIPDKVFSAVEEGLTVISSKKTEVTSTNGTETVTETVQTETVITKSQDEQPTTSAAVALRAAEPSISVSKKRQHVDPLDRDPKRMKGWLGMDDDDSSDEEAVTA